MAGTPGLVDRIEVECPWHDEIRSIAVARHGFQSRACPPIPASAARSRSSVVIVGGGLTGCATAYAFAASGVKVVLVEAGQVGRGSTGSATGWVGGDPGPAFVEVEKALGRRGGPAGVSGVAASGARFCRAASPPRHQVRVHAAGRRHRRDHARSGRSVEARSQSAARRRPRRAAARRARREERARPRCGRRHPRQRRRRARSLSRLPRPCGRSRRPRRDDLRAIAGAEDHVRPPEGRRHHGWRVDSRRSRGHRHRSCRRRSSSRSRGISGFAPPIWR